VARSISQEKTGLYILPAPYVGEHDQNRKNGGLSVPVAADVKLLSPGEQTGYNQNRKWEMNQKV
jgi:hypothetical protein